MLEAKPVRYPSLDVLRGIAILGTLATNIWIFTDPAGLVGYVTGMSHPDDAWSWVERVLQQLAQGKFLGLLTIMFGIGLAIQQRSAQRRGERWPGAYPWRATLLFVDGVVHYLLVAEFDVLMGYAVTGVVVAFVLAAGERHRRRWLVIAATIHVVLLTALTAALLLSSDDSGQSAPLQPNPYADGSWWDLVVFRIENAGVFRFEPIFILALSIALFLVGARLFASGVLAAEGRVLRRRLMIVGFAVALPIDFALGTIGGDAGVVFARYGTAPIVSLGILGLVAEFYVRRDRVGAIGRRLGEVGRTALSCYVLQNVVASTICYGWGFGLAATVSDAARVPVTIGVYLLVCAVIVTAAHLWLRRFDRGPVEWLWNASVVRLTTTPQRVR